MRARTARGVSPQWLSLGAAITALLLTAGCVGRPKEAHGAHRSFLSSPATPVAGPANTGGNSGTSGLGAGMLQSPGSSPGGTSGLGAGMLQSPGGAPSPTATPGK